MKYRGMTALAACGLVKERRVKVSPGDGFVELMLEVELHRMNRYVHMCI